MKTKDVDKKVILDYLRNRPVWANRSDIEGLFGKEIPTKLILSSLRSLVKRGLVEGCCCGCRGDFEITDLGRRTER